MQKSFLLVFILLTAVYFNVNAQDPAYPPAPAAPLNIVAAEYFVDTDPGVGNGNPVGLTPGVDINAIPATINTASLVAGVHRVYIRTLNAEGEWSISSVRQFVVDFDPAYPSSPAAPLNVVQAEYFVDTDPGVGDGTPISLSPGVDITGIPATINTASLTAATHRVYIRTLNTEGEWSISSIRQFIVDIDPAYPSAPAAPLNVVQAEYFVDTDPGVGNGTAISFSPGVDINNISADVNTASLVQAVHRLYVRSLNAEGEWSIASIRSFVVNEDPFYPAAATAPGNITRAEYFFDTDPGFGNGTAITITAAVNISDLVFAANTSSLTAGLHRLYIRSLDDWSLTSMREFEVQAPTTRVILSGALTGSFQTLKGAFDAINSGGGSGNVTATIVENTTETLQASLNQTNYTVLVIPDGNRIVEGNIADPLIVLNQADNVTIDGLSHTGTNTLTIRNNNTGPTANSIRIFGAAVNNTVKRCIIEASCTGNIISTGALVMLVDNEVANNNVIDSNYIRPASVAGVVNGISVGKQFTASVGTINNSQFINNRIENVFQNTSVNNHGIIIFNSVNNSIIRGNSVYNSLPYSNTINAASYVGIRVSSLNGSGSTIDSNYIGGTLPGATGGNLVISSASNSIGFFGITLSDAAVNPSSVTRNIIRKFDLDIANPGTTTINPFQGINVSAANLQAFNNNILGSETNNSILLQMKPGSTGTTGSFGYLLQTSCATPIADNFIGGFSITNTALAGSTVTPFFNIFDVRGNISSLNFTNNTIGSAAAGNMTFNSTTAGSFAVPAFFISSNAASPALNIDSNSVRNIAVTGGATLFAIRTLFGNAATTSSNVTLNGNTISNLSVSGNSGNIRGIQYDLAASVNNLSQLINIDGNHISNLSVPSGTGAGVQGIRIQNASTAVNRMRGRITNNTIDGFINNASGNSASRAIAISNDITTTDSLVIAENIINNLVSRATTVNTGNVSEGNGITYETMNSGVNGLVITRDNVISNISVQSTDNLGLRVVGIMQFGNNTLTERNRVFGLSNAAASASAKLTGLFLRSRNDDADVAMIRNNMIAINTATDASVAGIDLGDAAVKANIYHNSLLVEGSITGNSYALFKSATAVADIKNNILYNAATGAAYAIGLQTDATGYTGNNNYFVSPAATSLAQIGIADHTLATWQSATLQDANAQEAQSGVTTNPADLFLDKAAATLLVNTANATEPLKLSDKGTAIATVLFDFLGTNRSASTPDIGAHEFVFSAVPLRLISFSGNKQNSSAVLQWKTANEVNVNRFEVQRSDYGQQFVTIGIVSPGRSLYSFTDLDIFNSRSLVFYRLKSIDDDGAFSYSSIIRLSSELVTLLQVYPNPVADIVTISGLKQAGTIRLFDASGKLLQQQTVSTQSTTLNLSSYAKGMYVLQYQNGEEVINKKIIRQ